MPSDLPAPRSAEPPRHEMKVALGARAALAPARLSRLLRDLRPAFPARRVHTVYFDTPGYASYRASVEGLGRQLKLRVRWYGDTSASSAISARVEWKWSHGTHSGKHVVTVDVDAETWRRGWLAVRPVLRDALGPAERASFDALVVATLYGVYTRSYYQSADGACRVTVDEGLAFATPSRSPSNRHGEMPWPALAVLELKAPLVHTARLEAMLQRIDAVPQRFSKYATGVDLLAARVGRGVPRATSIFG